MSCAEFAIRRAYNDFGPDLMTNPVVADVLQQSMSKGCAGSLWTVAHSIQQPSIDGTIEAANHWRPFLNGALRAMIGDSVDYAGVANLLARNPTMAEELSQELAKVRDGVKRVPEVWKYGMLREQARNEAKDSESQLAFFSKVRHVDPEMAAIVLGNLLNHKPALITKSATLQIPEKLQEAMVERIVSSNEQAFTALPFIATNYTYRAIGYCAELLEDSDEEKYVAHHIIRDYLRSGKVPKDEIPYRQIAVDNLVANISGNWIPPMTFKPYVTALEDFEELMEQLAFMIKSPVGTFAYETIGLVIHLLDGTDRVITRKITPMLLSGFLKQHFTPAVFEEKFADYIQENVIFSIVKSEILMDQIIANIKETSAETIITDYVEKDFFSVLHEPYFARNSIPMAKLFHNLNKYVIKKILETVPEGTIDDLVAADNEHYLGYFMSVDLYRKRLFDIVRYGPPNLRQYYTGQLLDTKFDVNPETEPYPVKWFSSKFMGGMLKYHDFCNDSENLKQMAEKAKNHRAKEFWSEFVAAAIADHYGRSEKNLVDKLKASIQIPSEITLPKDKKVYQDKQLGDPDIIENFIEQDESNKVYLEHRGYPSCHSCIEDCRLCDVYRELEEIACFVVDKLHTLWNSHGTDVFISICSESITEAIKKLSPTDENSELIDKHKQRLKDVWEKYFANANAHRLEVGVATVPESMFETMGSLPNRKLWTLYPVLLNGSNDERETKQRAALYKAIKDSLKKENMWPAVAYLSLDPPVSSEEYVQDILGMVGVHIERLAQFEAANVPDDKKMLREILLKRYNELPGLAQRLDEPEEEPKRATFSAYVLETISTDPLEEDEAQKLVIHMKNGASNAILKHWTAFMTAVPNTELWKPIMQSFKTVAQWQAFRGVVKTDNFEKLYSSSKSVLEMGSIIALCQSIDADFTKLENPATCAPTSPSILLAREIGIIEGDVYGLRNSPVKKLTLPDCINTKVKIFTLAVENCIISKTQETYNEPPDHLAKLHLTTHAPEWSYPTQRILQGIVFTRLEAKRVIRKIPLHTMDKILYQALQETTEYPFLNYDPPKTPATNPSEVDSVILDNVDLIREPPEPPATIFLTTALEHYASQAINQDPTGSGITTKLRRDNLANLEKNCPTCKTIVLREMRKLLFPMAERLSIIMKYDRADYVLGVLAEVSSEKEAEAMEMVEAMKTIESVFMEGPQF